MSRIHELLLSLRYEWRPWTLFPILLLVPIVVLFSQDPLDLEKGEGKAVEARITQMTSTSRSRYQGHWPGIRVSAETPDGARGGTTALPPDLQGCEIGDLRMGRTPRPRTESRVEHFMNIWEHNHAG